MNLINVNGQTLVLALFIVLLSTVLEYSSVNALKCKCTQSSHKTPCQDGVCETPTGTSTCLMLDHPTTGRHYACSTSKLPEGECIEKATKTGAVVSVCPCDSSDYCNYKIWPSKSDDFDDDSDDYSNFGSLRSNGAARRQVSATDDSENSATSIFIKFNVILICSLIVNFFYLTK